MISAHEQTARKSGARLVHCCASTRSLRPRRVLPATRGAVALRRPVQRGEDARQGRFAAGSRAARSRACLNVLKEASADPALRRELATPNRSARGRRDPGAAAGRANAAVRRRFRRLGRAFVIERRSTRGWSTGRKALSRMGRQAVPLRRGHAHGPWPEGPARGGRRTAGLGAAPGAGAAAVAARRARALRAAEAGRRTSCRGTAQGWFETCASTAVRKTGDSCASRSPATAPGLRRRRRCSASRRQAWRSTSPRRTAGRVLDPGHMFGDALSNGSPRTPGSPSKCSRTETSGYSPAGQRRLQPCAAATALESAARRGPRVMRVVAVEPGHLRRVRLHPCRAP